MGETTTVIYKSRKLDSSFFPICSDFVLLNRFYAVRISQYFAIKPFIKEYGDQISLPIKYPGNTFHVSIARLQLIASLIELRAIYVSKVHRTCGAFQIETFDEI